MSLANVGAAPQAVVQLVTPDQVYPILANRSVTPAAKMQAIAGCFKWFQVQRDNDKAEFERTKANYLAQIAALTTSLENAQKANQDVQGNLNVANQNVENLQKQVNDKQGQINTLEENQRANQRRVDGEIERLNKKIQDQAAAELLEKQLQDQKAKELRQKRIDTILVDLNKNIQKYTIVYPPTPDWYFKLGLHVFRTPIDGYYYPRMRYYEKVAETFKVYCNQGKDPDDAYSMALKAHRWP